MISNPFSEKDRHVGAAMVRQLEHYIELMETNPLFLMASEEHRRMAEADFYRQLVSTYRDNSRLYELGTEEGNRAMVSDTVHTRVRMEVAEYILPDN